MSLFDKIKEFALSPLAGTIFTGAMTGFGIGLCMSNDLQREMASGRPHGMVFGLVTMSAGLLNDSPRNNTKNGALIFTSTMALSIVTGYCSADIARNIKQLCTTKAKCLNPKCTECCKNQNTPYNKLHNSIKRGFEYFSQIDKSTIVLASIGVIGVGMTYIVTVKLNSIDDKLEKVVGLIKDQTTLVHSVKDQLNKTDAIVYVMRKRIDYAAAILENLKCYRHSRRIDINC